MVPELSRGGVSTDAALKVVNVPNRDSHFIDLSPNRSTFRRVPTVAVSRQSIFFFFIRKILRKHTDYSKNISTRLILRLL